MSLYDTIDKIPHWNPVHLKDGTSSVKARRLIGILYSIRSDYDDYLDKGRFLVGFGMDGRTWGARLRDNLVSVSCW